ncbi:MAG: OmpA family protein [Alphaproteobacteria bacterium]|nr:OmpA family protein [Alphaproteobacteria bacterium]MBV9694945.1 OmpA family protein [Alphaproteobacteria bacterium]
MRSKSIPAFLTLAVLLGCESEPHYTMRRPHYPKPASQPPPPPPKSAPAIPPAPPAPQEPSYTGSAGPLARAGVGHYMDGLEADLRHYLRGIAVARPGDAIVLDLRDDWLFARAPQLSQRGREALRTVAAALRHYDRTTIWVNSYTDTRGTPEENLKTSQRDADAAAAVLRGEGIDGKRILATGLGRTHLKVATGTGVANPRNRRIEIRIMAKPD